jgi:outer membrane protein assembly factor BamA
MRRVGPAILFALVTSCAVAAHAEDLSGQPGRRNAWFVLPVVFSLPETSLAFGVTGGLHLVRPGLKTSSITPTVFYTVNRQSYGELIVQLFDSERTAISGELRAADFPYDFYGIGPLATKDAKESYAAQYAEVLLAREWEVVRGLRLGPKLHVRGERIADVQPSGNLASGGVPSGDYRAAGLGPTVTFDRRDDLFWPTTGAFVEVWALAYAAEGGRTFARASLEARRFTPLGGGHVLGVDVAAKAAAGDVPFTLLPRLGGARGLRGYYDGRWRDRCLWSTQAEWRFPIAWRVRGTAFAGVAGVAPSLARVGETRPRPAGGVGLRFRLTSTGLNVSGDVAFGEDGPLTYLTIGEAF